MSKMNVWLHKKRQDTEWLYIDICVAPMEVIIENWLRWLDMQKRPLLALMRTEESSLYDFNPVSRGGRKPKRTL